MGLDSVDLIITFEQKFKIEIPDQAAEGIGTIGQMATWLYQHLPLHPPERDLEGEILARLDQAFSQLGLPPVRDPTARLVDLLPPEGITTTWQALPTALGLALPTLNDIDLKKSPQIWLRRLGLPPWRPKRGVLASTVAELAQHICVLNYHQLIDFDRFSSQYEIMVAVMGITHELCGVEPSEMHRDSSFTNDLGID
jgi:acyl carrier protein